MKQQLMKMVFEDNVVMNWSTVQKCALILILACGMHLTWIVWKIYIFFQPSVWSMINMPLMRVTFWIDISFFCVLAALIYPTIYYREHKLAVSFMPWISIGLFTLTLCFGSYMVAP